ncbi:MAG: Gx transporter family protein [Thermodesulfovibrionales bacterium]|nr:Gx transporter family protein [Thermodesulfovibrionales bacterium]
MRLQDKQRIAVLSAIAIAIHSIENLIPTPIPWLRLGLSNIITLIVFLLFGLRPAFLVTLLRVTLSSMILGTFPGPAFILSLSGGLTGLAGLWLSSFVPLFGITGLSVISASFHILGQLAVAYYLFIKKTEAVLAILPVLIFFSTITGAVNGSIASGIVKKLKEKVRY